MTDSGDSPLFVIVGNRNDQEFHRLGLYANLFGKRLELAPTIVVNHPVALEIFAQHANKKTTYLTREGSTPKSLQKGD